MKKLLLFFLFLVISLAGRAQAIQFAASIPHTNGTPSGAPTGIGAWLRYDKTNKILYRWTGSAWTATLPGAVADGDKGDVTVSGSGTNWQLDASSVGNAELAAGTGGFYKGSGTIPSGVGATVTDEFAISRPGGGDFRVNDTGAHLYATNAGGLVEVAATDDGVIFSRDGTGDFGINSVGILVDDTRATPRGVEYTADYSATYNPRSLIDFGTAKRLISDSLAAGGAPTLQEVTDAGWSTTNNIQVRTQIAIEDNGGSGAIGSIEADGSLTANRTYTLPDRSGTIRVGENYKVYTALLSQSGTSAPAATVLENTLGGTVVWTRNAAGDYTGTLSGAFSSGKTWLSGAPIDDGDALNLFPLYFRRVDANTVSVRTLSGGSGSDDQLSATSIEIRVYP